MPAQELTRGVAAELPREMVGFLNSLVRAINEKEAAANADVVSPAASDLATVIALANELKAVVNSLQAKLRAAGLLEV